MTVFRTTTAINPKRLACASCGESERIWTDAQIAKWKTAHTNACPNLKENQS